MEGVGVVLGGRQLVTALRMWGDKRMIIWKGCQKMLRRGRR